MDPQCLKQFLSPLDIFGEAAPLFLRVSMARKRTKTKNTQWLIEQS
jgi:hypothetical protein